MSFYRWMMNNGAGILFLASLLIFAASLGGSFAVPRPFPSEPGESLDRLGFLLSLIGAFGTAVSHSALTFFGACLLFRLDAAWGRKA